MPRLGAGVVRTTQPLSQLARSFLLLGSTFMFFNGVKHLELAQAASISFMAPFIVVLLALPMLGEPISIHRIGAVLAGFVGVLIVIRPGSAVFQWASLLIVGSACCYALYQIFTRRVAGHDRPETSAFYSALIGTLVMAGVITWKGFAPPKSLLDAGLLASLGILGAAGHYCVARAMTYAAANVVAPFQYWQMVGSVIVGYLVSHRLPDAYTWLGASVIIGAGLYIGWRDARRV
ncbi:MAG TPA: DMT family transporter, partial [Hyphomicrobiaceae bacterium]|nr:DMT family transporter [Hyphomicrobiaceae bacterium]